ncbi:hypothetical protein [Victivallis sp. Marseille-Q1083]|uniref:baseplate complex protein n=1 Tax=Victivallis sp. Marseille-Q1083 TaxID=2717288 RepID=UPI00158D0626|nr:hypothetical protein [Victivallis sp. Marseille-Q1083]
MLLSANGRELTVPGKNIKINSSLPLERKDLSGQGSGSATAAAGNKPQELSVSLVLPIADKTGLSELLDFATAIDDAGDPVVYDIVDELAGLLKIHQVIFSGSLDVQEHDGLRAFSVSFKLQEVRSVSERLEENAAPETVEPDADGETVLPGTDPAELNAAIEEAVQ